MVIVVAVLVLAAGVGEVTGWINLRGPGSAAGGYQTQTCEGYPVHATGAISAAIDPAFSGWLEDAGQNLSAAVGGCFSVTLASDTGDGYLSLFGTTGMEFDATYAPPNSTDAGTLGSPVAVVPITLGAVSVIYNLPGVPTGLNLTGAVLAGIYNGSITAWNAPAIADLNPGVDLAGLPAIEPLHYASAAVASQALSEYLSRSSPSWNDSVGTGLTVDWPSGTAVASQSAMLADLSATPGALGYMESFGVGAIGPGVAALLDAAGAYASPNAVDTWIAANALANSTAVLRGNWTGFTLAGAGGVGAYPLAVLTYAGIYRDLGVGYSGTLSLSNATWLLTYLYWLTGVSAVAPLPPAFVTDVLNTLNNETFDGTTIVHLDSETGESGESGGETGEF
ncbi:MAG TPA: substrate-binding domain-containing protein [Thermoplasmata archaeon]|nr:substrate-binding domain-containing protein [Thermoplasmata archaeon]